MCIISTSIIRYTLIRYVPWLTRRFFIVKTDHILDIRVWIR